jgi:hypothetical protein
MVIIFQLGKDIVDSAAFVMTTDNVPQDVTQT